MDSFEIMNILNKYHSYEDTLGNTRYSGFPQNCIDQEYISPSLYHASRNEFGYTDGNYRLTRYELPIGKGEPKPKDYKTISIYNFVKEKFDERMNFAKEFHKLFYNKKINLIIGSCSEERIVGDFINDREFELL